MSFQPILPLSGYAGWTFLQRTLEKQQEAHASSGQIKRNTEYFAENIGKVRTAEELVRPFTSFRHAPHTLGDTGASCQTCHALNDGLDLSTRKPQMQTGAEAGPLRSCFAPLSKAACATCHHSNSGLNRCTDCHQYHVRNLSGVGH